MKAAAEVRLTLEDLLEAVAVCGVACFCLLLMSLSDVVDGSVDVDMVKVVVASSATTTSG